MTAADWHALLLSPPPESILITIAPRHRSLPPHSPLPTSTISATDRPRPRPYLLLLPPPSPPPAVVARPPHRYCHRYRPPLPPRPPPPTTAYYHILPPAPPRDTATFRRPLPSPYRLRSPLTATTTYRHRRQYSSFSANLLWRQLASFDPFRVFQ